VRPGRTTFGVPTRYRQSALTRLISAAAALPPREDVDSSKAALERYLRDQRALTMHIDAFRLDRRLVSRADFLEFFRALVGSGVLQWDKQGVEYWCRYCERAAGSLDLPVTGVTWAEASAYCACRGGRLPTHAELVRAVRRNSECPDLAELDGSRREHSDLDWPGLSPVGRPDAAKSWCGCTDILVNADEWTSTPYPSEISAAKWASRPEYVMVRKTPRDPIPLVDPGSGFAFPAVRYDYVGFRCAYSGPWPPDEFDRSEGMA
jgi:formylglycine-generating enzyme required for sulfatase activity